MAPGGELTDSLVKATAAQLSDLHHRQDAVLSEWTQECQEDEREHPDAERRAVRTIIRCFPSGPVRP